MRYIFLSRSFSLQAHLFPAAGDITILSGWLFEKLVKLHHFLLKDHFNMDITSYFTPEMCIYNKTSIQLYLKLLYWPDCLNKAYNHLYVCLYI